MPPLNLLFGLKIFDLNYPTQTHSFFNSRYGWRSHEWFRIVTLWRRRLSGRSRRKSQQRQSQSKQPRPQWSRNAAWIWLKSSLIKSTPLTDLIIFRDVKQSSKIGASSYCWKLFMSNCHRQKKYRLCPFFKFRRLWVVH